MGGVNFLLEEVFIEYAIAMVFVLLRFFTRWWTAGFRACDLGDVFAATATVVYTLETAGIYLLSTYGNKTGLNEKTAMQVPESEVLRLIIGSKILFASWLWYITFIWCLKGVLLVLYTKLGQNIARQEHVVKLASVFCVCTYLVCVLTHLLICTPIWRSRQIKPYPGEITAPFVPDYIVISVLNVLSDLFIMAIPMPLLSKVQLPLKRKLALLLIFGLGIFVIVATILRAYYSLLSLETLDVAVGWTTRETFCATVVVCNPGIKPLFDKAGGLKSNSSIATASTRRFESRDPQLHPTRRYGRNETRVTSDQSSSVFLYPGKLSPKSGSLEMVQWARRDRSRTLRRTGSNRSDEQNIVGEDRDKEIVVTTEYRVTNDASNRGL